MRKTYRWYEIEKWLWPPAARLTLWLSILAGIIDILRLAQH